MLHIFCENTMLIYLLIEAFSRIAPAVPIIANVIICENLFEVLTISTGGRLHFSIYEKYLNGLESVTPMRHTSGSDFLFFLLELLLPVMEVGKWLLSLVYWDDPLKSLLFSLISTFIIFSNLYGCYEILQPRQAFG
ncbi:hypothetical protein Gotri_012610 [Gossypium trilobum]|uniref:Uncharacterized protein n=1 Tax=Gossypium trilobum TaxID=34281 RepID=A0A7J9DRW0_9ROSI|nr:hypothetical protein [Gossypium trilobum]